MRGVRKGIGRAALFTIVFFSLSLRATSGLAWDLNAAIGFGDAYGALGVQVNFDHGDHRVRTCVGTAISGAAICAGYDYLFGDNISLGLTAGRAYTSGGRTFTYQSLHLTSYFGNRYSRGWSVNYGMGNLIESHEEANREDESKPYVALGVGYTF